MEVAFNFMPNKNSIKSYTGEVFKDVLASFEGTTYCALRTMYHALCTMYHALCTMHYALCTMHCELCTMHCALYTMYYALDNCVYFPLDNFRGAK